jgi:hypothetical protein
MFCPMCGAPNEEDADFCGNCGATLNPDEAIEAAPLPADSPDVVEAVTGESAVAAEAGEVDEGVDEVAEVEVLEVDAGVDEVPEIEVLEVDAEPELMEAPPPPPPVAATPYTAGVGLPTSGMAVAALVMGIVGLTLLPLVGSILALIFGYMARNDIRQRPDEVSGDGLALAGIVMGWIAIGLSVLGLLVFGGIAVCGVCGTLGAGGGY